MVRTRSASSSNPKRTPKPRGRPPKSKKKEEEPNLKRTRSGEEDDDRAGILKITAPSQEGNLHNLAARALRTGAYSDFVLVARGGSLFRGHRAFVFTPLAEHATNNGGVVDVTDFDNVVIKAVLNLLYLGVTFVESARMEDFTWALNTLTSENMDPNDSNYYDELLVTASRTLVKQARVVVEKKDAAPSEEDPAPTEENPAPTEEDPAPTEEDVAPTKEDPAPTEDLGEQQEGCFVCGEEDCLIAACPECLQLYPCAGLLERHREDEHEESEEYLINVE